MPSTSKCTIHNDVKTFYILTYLNSLANFGPLCIVKVGGTIKIVIILYIFKPLTLKSGIWNVICMNIICINVHFASM